MSSDPFRDEHRAGLAELFGFVAPAPQPAMRQPAPPPEPPPRGPTIPAGPRGDPPTGDFLRTALHRLGKGPR